MHLWGMRFLLLAALMAGVLATPLGGPVEDGVGAPAAAASAPAPRPVERVVLRADGPGVQARDLALTTARLRSTLSVQPGVDLVALTWRGSAPAVQLRARTAGRWGTWQTPEVLPDAPDRASGEGSRQGTDQVWTPGADALQVRAAGPVPRSLRLSLVAVEETPADLRTARLGRSAAAAPDASAAASARNKFRPALRGRGAWGADERWRSGSPTYNRTVQQVHVHHTVNSNDYRPGEVPGLIRGMYRYHTGSLGWSDLGYNAVVDRFGRTWVGRAGGITRRVRGAHTLGFNSTSTGVAVLGNFETARPSSKVVTAIVRFAAWKLHKDGRNPRGRVTVFSHGSDRFRYGAKPRLPVIDGHRDTSETACPGEYLYRKLPVIRQRAAARVARMR
ncbi:N-acetylmuramoyl-L-alanine amidase [Nocardioides nanhaiensis]|uniref:N-acetylmuramoyl-L-alanine amidase n=2 Tax=Nocardioides nanhaiensis TaxID=1476871 RepID=A0ABP8W0X0_9ACTN